MEIRNCWERGRGILRRQQIDMFSRISTDLTYSVCIFCPSGEASWLWAWKEILSVGPHAWNFLLPLNFAPIITLTGNHPVMSWPSPLTGSTRFHENRTPAWPTLFIEYHNGTFLFACWSMTPGLRRSPGEANGNPLQYSCLGNPMDTGAWRAAVHGVAKELDMT